MLINRAGSRFPVMKRVLEARVSNAFKELEGVTDLTLTYTSELRLLLERRYMYIP